ncbi:MAG: patatin-like phospholipase family protein [Thermoanaerobaculia bacterium]
MAAARSRRPKLALALAGGAPEGAIWEIGALRALEEAVDGLDLNELDLYVGLSAGAFLAANLANGLTTAQMCRAIVKHEPGEHPFVPKTFFTPAVRELARRGARVPRLVWEALADVLRDPSDLRLSESLTRLSRALPVGVFANEPIRRYLERIYALPGRTDDFRRLRRPLVVVAADLDSGQAVRFGEPGMDRVPISVAVQASSALPGLYPPVEIDGRYYVDGVLLKTLHASVALDAGADLVLCFNPLVPVDTAEAVARGVMTRGKLVDRGLPAVLAQTFRTLIRSRLAAGMGSYEGRYDGADLLLFEPRRDDYRMFFTNIFSFSSRRAVCEHAYETTRADLLSRYETLAPAFAKRGLALSRSVLEEPRELWTSVGLSEDRRRPHASRPGSPLAELETTLDRLDAWLGKKEGQDHFSGEAGVASRAQLEK